MKILQHNEIIKKSIPVTNFGSQVLPYIKEMAELCRQKHGNRIGVAIAHCQVEKENPLTFYVLANGDAIINPVILSVKEKTLMFHSEGCLSFMNKPEIKVPRYRMIKVVYELFSGEKYQVVRKNISDMQAYIMQHEIDHFELKYIYDK